MDRSPTTIPTKHGLLIKSQVVCIQPKVSPHGLFPLRQPGWRHPSEGVGLEEEDRGRSARASRLF